MPKGTVSLRPSLRRRCGSTLRGMVALLTMTPAWTTLLCAALALATSSGSAQAPGPVRPPGSIGGAPVILAEHGDPAVALLPGVTVLGLAVFDIATAPASARWYNERNPGASKSPRTAALLSVGWTAAPVLAGTVAGIESEVGVLMIASGIVLGPSAGHWYAGRTVRGLTTAGLRLGLGVLAGMAALAAS